MTTKKKNTAKPRSIAKLHRAVVGIKEHLERHPRDSMSATRIVNLNNRINGK
jgi:ribosomal protein S15P/S13E